MIEDAHWCVADGRGIGAGGGARGGAQEGVRGDIGVAPNGDGDEGYAGGRGFGGGGGGRARGEEVAADADVGADDGAPAEDEVLRAVQLGAAGDFVAGVGGDEGGFGRF
jgi:U1 small nuclear ribonucleoprotein